MIAYITKRKSSERHAGGKAPNDIDALCERRGWQRFEYPNVYKDKPGKIDRAVRAWKVSRFWTSAASKLKKGDIVFYQHPMRYGTKIAVKHIRSLQEKGVRFIALIHDLDSLRYPMIYTDNRPNNTFFEDGEFLKQFDVLICHNGRMKKYLTDQGVPEGKLVCLELFDYLTGAIAPSPDDSGDSLVVAGNLDPKKCAYVYKLAEVLKEIPLYAYGVNYQEASGSSLRYEGSRDPEELPGVLKGKYGVIWDGNSISACVGAGGDYMRYNNPHKLSLYMAAGIPVITWKKAAIADFVEQNGVGITVDSLEDIEETLRKVSAAEYHRMKENAAKFREKVTEGFYFYRAADRAIRIASESK